MELQIPTTTLHDPTSGDTEALSRLSSWRPVVTDLLHQHTSAQRPAAGDRTRRFPDAALRRHVEIRDRYCVMIGCRAPARSTDTDHTHDRVRGGATVDHNLGNVCRHDHRMKHESGWQLHQPEAGVFRWISRLGHVYHLHKRLIIEPLPDPLPRHGPAAPLFIQPDDNWDAAQGADVRTIGTRGPVNRPARSSTLSQTF
ncbi:MAG: HNH endonuclease [Pseudonocardiales bacterium]|nr:HNH endonuclease [Pseudonocardiales bacterium]